MVNRMKKNPFRMIFFSELIKGLLITLRWFFKGKITEIYPDTKPVLPYRSKGRLHVDIETCISCKLCENACPEYCIKVIPPPKEIFKTDKRPAEFYISLEHCIHCGLCVDPCPTGSIHHSMEFELADYSDKNFIYDKETLPYNLIVKQYGKGGK